MSEEENSGTLSELHAQTARVKNGKRVKVRMIWRIEAEDASWFDVEAGNTEENASFSMDTADFEDIDVEMARQFKPMGGSEPQSARTTECV